MMSGCGDMFYCCGGSPRSNKKVSILPSLLIFYAIVSVTVGGPTRREGQKEVVEELPGRSMPDWPYSVTSNNGGQGTNAHLDTEKRTTESIQLCGYRLLEAVRSICRGHYVEFNTRSDPDMKDEESMMRDLQSSHPRRHQARNGHAHHHNRSRRSITAECCQKPCSVNVILRYCGRS